MASIQTMVIYRNGQKLVINASEYENYKAQGWGTDSDTEFDGEFDAGDASGGDDNGDFNGDADDDGA